ncbi:MAG: hypothetical protein HY062_03735, partial [Bacteroidetes bacterium]|nr:hypothetical protein [Bacteroidota bacterium]
TLQEFSKKVSIRKDIITQRVFVHTNTHELEYYLINNDFQNALSKTKDIEKEIVKYKLDIEPYHMIYFYYLQAITLIYLGEFNKALKYINRIINDFKMEARPQVYMRVEVLNAIVHFELKNYSLVLSLSRQILKHNASHNILIPLEEKILKTFTKITGAKQMGVKEELALFQEIAQEISESNAVKKVSANSLIDNYDKWIMSKIKRKHVSDLYK